MADKWNKRKRVSLGTRKDVLLRCSFRCTWPGCLNLAADLHHLILRSKGGRDAHDNLIGLCRPCHKRVHYDNCQIYDAELDRWLKPLDAAKCWLARQMQHCPVRLDEVRRSILFEEVEHAIESTESMIHHSQAIYNSYHWSAYEVFLKAAWGYLSDNSQVNSRLGAILLLKMVQLYRRRPGQAFQKAARRKLVQLKSLLPSLGKSDHVSWMRGVVGYEEAYMRFLEAAGNKSTEKLFESSAELEQHCGRRIGHLVSKAQMAVSGIRGTSGIGADLEKQRVKLLTAQNEMASIEGPLSESWVNLSIPVHLAYIDLVQQRYDEVIHAMVPMAKKGVGAALWYSGIAKIRSGEEENRLADLERAPRRYYQDCVTEHRTALLVGFGDAHALSDNHTDAKAAYAEAVRQPANMDNQEAIKIARRRLDAMSLGRVIRSHDDIYFG